LPLTAYTHILSPLAFQIIAGTFALPDGILRLSVKYIVFSCTGVYRHYGKPHELCDAGVSVATMELLADADAFRSIGMDRRKALWEVMALKDRPIGAFQGQKSNSDFEPQIELPFMKLSEHVIHDYISTGISIKAHIVSFIR
jgi:error-prone DNA polymerase